MLTDDQLAARVAREVRAGERVVLLGSGLPRCLSARLRHARLITTPESTAPYDVALLWARQVSASGDVVVDDPSGDVRAALVSARRVVGVLRHLDASGAPTVLRVCTRPVRARQVVDRIVTDLAVLDVTARGLRLIELAPGGGIEDVLRSTGATVALVEPDRI